MDLFLSLRALLWCRHSMGLTLTTNFACFRFDLLSGMNGQEGATQLLFDLGGFAATKNKTIANGVSMELARDFLRSRCASMLTPLSPDLCAEFVIKTYRLEYTRSDRDRAVRLADFIGINHTKLQLSKLVQPSYS